MGVVENVFGAVIAVILLIMLGVALTTQLANNTRIQQKLTKQQYLQELYSSNLDSIIDFKHIQTGKSIGLLLSNTVFYGREVLRYPIKGTKCSVNASLELKKLMDTIFGEGKYYVIIEPFITNVSLVFLFDGSDSLKEERQYLANIIQDMLANLSSRFNLNIQAKVYVLSRYNISSDNNPCRVFTNIQCETLQGNKLYCPSPNYNTMSCDCDEEQEANDYRCKYDIIAPKLSDPNRPTSDYYEADWSAGVAFIANQSSKRLSELIIIFPISDELPTSSIPEQCFETDFHDQTGFLRTGCDICELSNDSSTAERAWRSVLRTNNMLKQLPRIKIYALNAHSYDVTSCDYRYDILRHAAVKQYLNAQESIKTYCEPEHNLQVVCKGCFDNPPRDIVNESHNAMVCFHPEVGDLINKTMTNISKTTNGKMLLLSNAQRIPSLISEALQHAKESYTFRIGNKEQNPSIQSIGFERFLPMPGIAKEFTKMDVLIYLKPGNISSKDVWEPYFYNITLNPKCVSDDAPLFVGLNIYDASHIITANVSLINKSENESQGTGQILFNQELEVHNGYYYKTINSSSIPEGVDKVLVNITAFDEFYNKASSIIAVLERCH